MRWSSGLGCSEENALSVMPGFGKKCTTTVDGHFEAQKGNSVVVENVKASYCGERQSLKERCDRRHSHDVFTPLPLVLHQNLDDLGISSYEEKKYRRHRTCNQRTPFSIPSDIKRNSSSRGALSTKHAASKRKYSLIMRETEEESSVLMTETLTTTPSAMWARTRLQESLPNPFSGTEEKPLFEIKSVDHEIYPKAMCEVPISNILNDIRNLAVRRVAAGLEPHMSSAARIRDENVEIWESAWLILSRGILWSGTMGPYGPHKFHRLAWVKNYCDSSCCNDETPPFTLMWEGSDENREDVLPQHILKFQSGVYIALNSVEALLEWASVLQQAAWFERGLYCEKRTSQPPESVDSCQWLKIYFESQFK